MKTSQLCAIRIGIDTFVLPMADGLRLVDIMSKAIPVKPLYTGNKRFQLASGEDLKRVNLQLIRRDEIDIYMPSDAMRNAPSSSKQLEVRHLSNGSKS